MYIGVQYFRPPNPLPEDWEGDLKTIRDHGIKLIRFWLPWRYVEPEKGTWRFEDYDRLFELSAKNGLKVLVQLVPESAPDWAAREHPDKLFLEADGRPIRLHAHPMLQIGGWPGLSFDRAEVQQLIDKFFQEAVSRYLNAEPLFGWDVWNEIQMSAHISPYDEGTIKLYREFLRQEYGDIDNYNQVHYARLKSFDEIHILPEENRLTKVAVDMHRFGLWKVNGELKRRADCVRKIDNKHIICAHYGCGATMGGGELRDNYHHAPLVDVYGMSVYLEECHNYLLTKWFAEYDYVAKEKPWWVFEHSGSRMVYLTGHTSFTGDQLINRILLAKSYGADGFLLWQYRPERYGQEAPNFGLVEMDGKPNQRLKAVSRVVSFCERHKEIIDSFTPDRCTIGLLCEPYDFQMWRVSNAWKEQKILPYDEFHGWFKAFQISGFNPELFHVEDVLAGGIPPHIKMLVIPGGCWVAREGLSKILETWVKGGGILIGGPFLGVFNESLYANKNLPPQEFSQIFGIKLIDRIMRDEFNIKCLCSKYLACDVALKGIVLQDIVTRADDVVELGKTEFGPGITYKKYGRGAGIYVTSFLGNIYWDKDTELPHLIQLLTDCFGLRREFAAEPGALVRQGTCKGGKLIFAINLLWEKSVQCHFPSPVSGDVYDLLNDEKRGECSQGDSIDLTLSPAEVKVLLIQ